MHNRHVTHLINRYVGGQLNPSQCARVVNHVRVCDSCRAALARQERVASDLGRDLPALGYPPSGQLADAFAGVMQDVQAQRWQDRLPLHTWLPGVTVAVVMLLVIAVALPMVGSAGERVEAAQLRNRPVSTASPTPGLIETDEARVSPVDETGPDAHLIRPRATVALVSRFGGDAGATPAPVPGLIVSPEVH
jgi:anti-sigma factor RsiW